MNAQDIALGKLKTHLQNLEVLKANDSVSVKRMDWKSSPSLIVNGKYVTDCDWDSRKKMFKVDNKRIINALKPKTKPNNASLKQKRTDSVSDIGNWLRKCDYTTRKWLK